MFRTSCSVSKFKFLVIFGHFGPNYHFRKSMKCIKSMKFLLNWLQFFFSEQFSIIYAFTALWKLKNKEMAIFLLKIQFYHMFCHFSCLWHFGLIVTKFIFINKNAAISLFLIAQRAVKAWSKVNCQEKMNCGQVNTNFIDLMHFIDFLKW